MRGITIATIVALAPLHALADDAKDPHFEKGTELKAKGDIAGACTEFKLALDANPAAVGLVLNVAQCNEDLGRPHTAKSYFTKLKQLAGELGLPEYARTAEEHLAKLDKKPTTLALTFEEPPDSATKVTIGDESYDLAKGTSLEVNPGKQRLVVSHPGRVTLDEPIDVKEGEVLPYHVKKLVSVKKVNNTYRNVGIAVTSVGAVGVIAGGIVGLVAKSNYDSAFKPIDPTANPLDQCKKLANGQVACGSGSEVKVQNALKLGDTATGVMIAGGVLVVAGGVLWFAIGPREIKEKPVAFVPVLAPDRAGFAVVGRF